MFLSSGQQYNLTGLSEYASLGKAFKWTCGMFLPPNQTAYGVLFLRETIRMVVIGMKDMKCGTQSANSRYSYECLAENEYTLTIPAENMTEIEQKSKWRCEYVFDSSYRSPDVILNIAGKLRGFIKLMLEKSFFLSSMCCCWTKSVELHPLKGLEHDFCAKFIFLFIACLKQRLQ